MKDNVFNFKSRDIDIEQLKLDIMESSPTTAVYIGSDSKQFRKNKQDFVAYVTVVILHIDGNSGGKIYKQYSFERDYGNLRQRLMKEVELAINLGYEIIDFVEDRPFAVHLDLNTDPSHKSHVCIKEATGYVMGMLGIMPVFKPDAFAASTVSDRWAVKEANSNKRKRS